MKTAGVVGGIGPESTIEYYRGIVAACRERTRDGRSPRVIINSIDLRKVLDLAGTNQLAALAEYLLEEIERLARAGADFGALAANTVHVVFDLLRPRSPIPLISIVETTCDAARRLGLRRLGLFGTRFTMQGDFYARVFLPAGLSLVLPSEEEQAYVHEKYLSELVNGVFLAETRQGLLSIVRRLRTEERIDGLILGGTELPLILREPMAEGIPLLDATRLHVEEIVARLLA